MAKGSPTADETAGFGVGAAPAKAKGPNIMPGASLTKAPTGLASGSGYWSPNDKLPPGVTAQWVPPAAAPTTVAPTPAVNRNLLAEAMGRNNGVGTQYAPNAENTRMDRLNALMGGNRGSRGGGASQSDRQGATTSGRDNWGGSSGGRGWW